MQSQLPSTSDIQLDPAIIMNQHTVIELTVNNHPGVMSHICGLFARRAYNVEGILCMPVGSGRQSRIWLLVHRDARFEQMVRQVTKLQDVLEVRHRGVGRHVFQQLETLFETGQTS
jgi:acetolactate synthase-1/3 small subunit